MNYLIEGYGPLFSLPFNNKRDANWRPNNF